LDDKQVQENAPYRGEIARLRNEIRKVERGVQVTGPQLLEEAHRIKTEVKDLFKDLETEHITVELEAK